MALRNTPAFRAIATAAMLMVFAITLYESSQARGQPGVVDLTTNEAYIGHFAVYGVMVFCAMIALGRPTLLAVATLLTFAVGLGVSMELYQAFEPTRTASAADAFANAAGAVFGLITYGMTIALLEPARKQARRSVR